MRQKVLFIITKSNMGGAQRYVYDLASLLPKDSYEVNVACGGNGPLVSKLVENGIPVSQIKNFERDINLLKELKAAYELYRIIKTYKPDIVHLNSSKAGGTGALVARLCGVKRIVFTAHGWPFHEPRNIVWRFLAWKFSYLTVLLSHTTIVVSQYDFTHNFMFGLRKKIVHIPNGLPYIAWKTKEASREFFAEKFMNERPIDSTIWIGTIAEYVRNKNLMAAVHAVHALIKSGVQCCFILIGNDGGERAQLSSYIHAHNLDNHIFLTGYIDEAREYLKAFDIFLLPSLKEGLPYVLLESGLAHIAPIASGIGGIPDIITHEQSGILIDPKNPQSITTALRLLIESPATREQYAQDFEDKVQSEFGGISGSVSMLDATQEVYDGKGSRAS